MDTVIIDHHLTANNVLIYENLEIQGDLLLSKMNLNILTMSNLLVANNTLEKKEINIVGDTYVNTLTINGSVLGKDKCVLNNTLTVHGITDLSHLHVLQESVLDGPVLIQGKINVNNEAIFGALLRSQNIKSDSVHVNKLYVEEDTYLDNDTFIANLHSSNLRVKKAQFHETLVCESNLIVQDVSHFQDDVNINKSVFLMNIGEFNSNISIIHTPMTIYNDLRVHANLHVDVDTSLNTVEVNDKMHIMNNNNAYDVLLVDGPSTFTSKAIFSSIKVQNNVNVQGTLLTTNLSSQNDLVVTSDKRQKDKIDRIKNPFDLLENIFGYRYVLKNDPLQKTKCGLLAQEVQQNIPETVYEDNSGKLGISYGSLISVLIEAIHELKYEVQMLKKEKFFSS